MIYLAQSDTTAGFLSKNKEELNILKGRPKNTPVLKEVDSLSELKNFTRVPQKFKNIVRRAQKTTFIYPNNESIRVVKDKKHLLFLQKHRWLYSTSANKTSLAFDRHWAFEVADVVVEDERGLFEGEASQIFKLSRSGMKRIR
ncbi:MAG: Sua5 YciO YrdC YwlC family protein [Epsilonproteobacteria bacterium]|nr:Sua5 YciO YrdC YwlC family protein [Campylobacterota bacterium]